MVAARLRGAGRSRSPTGGYAYDRRIIAELRAARLRASRWSISATAFRARRRDRARPRWPRLRRVPAGRPIVIDGLALGRAAAKPRRRLRATHPLDRAGASSAGARNRAYARASRGASARASARRSPRPARRSSPARRPARAACRRLRRRRRDAITVARPGNDPVSRARGRGRQRPVSLLAVGAVVPRKGYDVLIEALGARLPISTGVSSSPAIARAIATTAGALATRIACCGLGGRVAHGRGGQRRGTRRGSTRDADLFVLASRFEGYGMAFAEAIAHGLPVVGTKAGAIPETVPDGAGILVPPDDVAALAAALRTMIADRDLRERCAAAARRAALQLPTWDATAQTFLRVLRGARHERLFGGMAGAARALRPGGAQPHRARRGRARRSPARPPSRSSISPAAPARPCGRSAALLAAAAELAPGRQRRDAARRAPRRAAAARRTRSTPSRSTSPTISRRALDDPPISSPRRRCSISSRPAWLDRLVAVAGAARLPALCGAEL